MNGTRVRRARAGEAVAVFRLLQAAFTVPRPTFEPTALRQSVTSIEAELTCWWVAEEPGRGIVSCAKAWTENGYGTFAFLATRPPDRRRGVASRLVDHLLGGDEPLNGVGDVRIVLRRTLADNIRFFERRGFRYLEPFHSAEHAVYHRPKDVP